MPSKPGKRCNSLKHWNHEAYPGRIAIEPKLLGALTL